jgi:Cu-Zn family superoxide dismutase
MKAICIIPSYGRVSFSQCCKKHKRVTVSFDLFNFLENATHAIHIHEFGDLSDGCKSLGPHYNPTNETHGSPDFPDAPRHAGDLINNFTTDDKGRFVYSYVDDKLSKVDFNDIYGRSVVIHCGIDDLGRGAGKNKAESLKTGNAGTRLACGIIGRKGC